MTTVDWMNLEADMSGGETDVGSVPNPDIEVPDVLILLVEDSEVICRNKSPRRIPGEDPAELQRNIFVGKSGRRRW